jgi:hypothetical protein
VEGVAEGVAVGEEEEGTSVGSEEGVAEGSERSVE